MTDGIIVYDAAGRLSSMNLATHALFDLEPGEQATASVARCDLLREDGTALTTGDSPLITMQQSEQGFEGAASLEVRSRANQTVRWLSFSTSPIQDTHSRVTGYVSSIRDVTDRLETIHALRIVSSAAGQMSSTLVGERVIAALTKAASELCSATGEPRRRAELFVIDGPAMTSAADMTRMTMCVWTARAINSPITLMRSRSSRPGSPRWPIWNSACSGRPSHRPSDARA